MASISITIEGQDMTGKQTIAEDLRSTLIALVGKERPVVKIDFPNYRGTSGRLINDYLFGRIDFIGDRNYSTKKYLPICTQLLYVCDFFQEMDKIDEFKKQDAVIIYDRNWFSAWAFGPAQGMAWCTYPDEDAFSKEGYDFPSKQECLNFYLNTMADLLSPLGKQAKIDYLYVLLREELGYAKGGQDKNEKDLRLMQDIKTTYKAMLDSPRIKDFAGHSRIIMSEKGKSKQITWDILREVSHAFPEKQKDKILRYIEKEQQLLKELGE